MEGCFFGLAVRERIFITTIFDRILNPIADNLIQRFLINLKLPASRSPVRR